MVALLERYNTTANLKKNVKAEFLLIRSEYCLQLVDAIRILPTLGTNYAIWNESRQYMTLDTVSKSFPLPREDPSEPSCMPETECSFNTPLSLEMRIGRRGHNVKLVATRLCWNTFNVRLRSKQIKYFKLVSDMITFQRDFS